MTWIARCEVLLEQRPDGGGCIIGKKPECE